MVSQPLRGRAILRAAATAAAGPVAALTRSTGCAGVVTALMLSRALAQAPDIISYATEGDRAERLLDGEIVRVEDVDFSGVYGGQSLEQGESTLVMFVVEASEADVWSVFTSFETHADFMPQMASSSVESRGADGEATAVCYVYEMLVVESTACIKLHVNRPTGTIVGVLSPARSDDRLEGMNYLWRMQRWRAQPQLLLAYHQRVSYSGFVAALAEEAFVGIREAAEAVRERIRAVATDSAP